MEFLCHRCDHELVIYLVHDEDTLRASRLSHPNDCQCSYTDGDLMAILEDAFNYE